MKSPTARTTASLAALTLAAATAAQVASPAPAAAPPAATAPATQPAIKPATTADLGGMDRYLTYVDTDKPIYRANEKVYVRAVLLNAATHQPLPEKENVAAQVQILGPRGEVVSSGGAISQNSVVAFGWTVPPASSGGEYTFKITYPATGYTPAERKFDVRIYRAPRLKSQVKFVRDGYGPGDKVTASLHSERAEGGFPAGAKVTVIARVDDHQIFTGPATIDAKGDCTASFDLPKAMETGEGTLAFAIEDGGTIETASKTIPILLQTLDLAIYPESGDAVAGVPNRYYIEGKTPAKKPADMVGQIVDSKGKKVADVRTEHEGRGRFEFTPVKGEAYTLKLTEPAGIAKTWPLPAAKDSGVVIHAADDIVLKGQPLRLKILGNTENFSEPTKFKVTVSRREVPLASATLAATYSPRRPAIYSVAPYNISDNEEFKLPPEADGVLTVTVWNDNGEPMAERLIYRQPAHEIKVAVKPDQSTYTPGGKATLNITTTDENGEPIAANVGLTVTDDAVLEMIDKREQAPRLPVMVLLDPEVRDLADAHVYLDPANPKAALATDLLLGTQGWRRFALMDSKAFMAKYGDDASRVLAFKKEPEPQMMLFGAAEGGAAGRRGGRGGAIGAVDRRAVADAPMAAPLLLNDQLQQNGEMAQAREMQADDQKALRANKEVAAEDLDALDHQPAAAAAPMAPGGFGGGGIAIGGRGGGGRRAALIAPGSMLVVRQFAHDLRPNWSPTDRSDFTETIYWNADLTTDSSGHAAATFNLSDSVTTFRAVADAFSSKGTLGNTTATLQSIQPFYIEPKLPLEVTAGDVIDLPVSIVNNTRDAMTGMSHTVSMPDAIKLVPTFPVRDNVPAMQRIRNLYALHVGDDAGNFDITIKSSSGQFADNVTRSLRVTPKGFPTKLAFGGLIDAKTPATKEFTIPPSLVPHSLQTFATVYPSPMANLTDAVAALLREPSGCFEQTSSTNYPMAMAQLYFTTHQGVDPKLQAKAVELLTHGYERLTSFECKDKGYEWFGGAAPGHEALTAYGLMEFHDMQAGQLAIVDDKMLDRTRTWLLSRRDGKGGFERNAKSIDSFGGAPPLTTDAYIVWALLQAGETTLQKETAAVLTEAKASSDSYVLALAANIGELTKDHATAKDFMTRLAKKQNKEGAVDGGLTSITRSGGQALAIETTALSTLAWNQEKDFAGNAESALTFLADSCKAGRFGSTQSTILALKAIVACDQANAHPKAPGQVTLLIDNKPFGQPIAFSADSTGAINFLDFAAQLPPGPHSLSVQMADGSQMPFTLGVNFNSTTPASDKQCKLDLSTRLKDAQLAEGGITEARVIVSNISKQDAATPVAIVGIPGGLEVRHDQLKELVKAGKIDAYEVNGREVVLYWRQIKAGAKADVSLSLTAAVPGSYSAPASRVYEYYTDEFKQWADGTTVVITPK